VSSAVADPVASAPRDFVVLGEGCYSLKAAGLSLTVDRLRIERHELVGELAIYCTLPGSQTIGQDQAVSIADFNLSSLRSRLDRARFLAERAKALDYDWFSLIEDLCQRVITAERSGRPAVFLRDLARPTEDPEIEVDGFPLLRQHATIVFGDCATGKSQLALYWGGNLANAGYRVLFADWELSADDHRLRLERLFGSDMPPVQYVRCDRPLTAEVDRLRRICRAESIDLVIVDSIAVASDGPPEAAEVATSFFRALRSLGPVGALCLAHITKGEAGDMKPFGSAFWANLARSTWNIKQTATDPGRMAVGLYHRKANLSGLRPALGYELEFDAERTMVRRVSVAETAELAEHLPLKDRIRHAVRTRPMTIAALADEIGARVDTVDRTIRRYPGMFRRLPGGEDGAARIALAERRTG
jgi:hypothetical protein